MLRTIMTTGTAICLTLGSGLARADHDRELRYVVGGAIMGAALGELAYAAEHGSAHGYGLVGYGYRRSAAYPPPRFRGRDFRRWSRHGFRHGYPYRRNHRRARHYF